MSCVSTASLLMLVNGSPTKEFSMRRGLRKGCPLSPFLFNLVVESLSIILMKAISLGLLSGARISNVGDWLSHI